MTVNYVTSRAGTASGGYYCSPQHTQNMLWKQTAEFLHERTGYAKAQIEAAFQALKKVALANTNKGYITNFDGVLAYQTAPKGAFASAVGPWVVGENYLVVNTVIQDAMRNAIASPTLVNNTEGAEPRITSVLDKVTGEYNTITGSNVFSIAGADLAPDMTKSDEGVTFVNDSGTVVAVGEISVSELQVVECHLDAAHLPPAGEYTLTVRTRAGLGEEFGVAVATRKITFK